MSSAFLCITRGTVVAQNAEESPVCYAALSRPNTSGAEKKGTRWHARQRWRCKRFGTAAGADRGIAWSAWTHTCSQKKLWVCVRRGERVGVTEEECADCPHWEASPVQYTLNW